MNRLLQSSALVAYRITKATGVLRFPPARRLFETAYHIYKERFEARHIGALRSFIRPGSSVVDVGANIGFFTLNFMEWVSSPGVVLAIEPGRENFEMLKGAVGRRDGAGRVVLVEGAAADVDGMLRLVLNPDHPADHKLGSHGVPVSAHRLDTLMEARGWPDVSLVKIDVQGAELRVLHGAEQLLRRCRPFLYVEIDDVALRQSGSSAELLISTLTRLGYEMCHLDSSSLTAVTPSRLARLRAEARYGDYLFRPVEVAGA